jgi:hypothetical protein
VTAGVVTATGLPVQAGLPDREPPAAARALPARFPARPVAASWPGTGQGRARVIELVNRASSAVPEPASALRTRRQGLPVLLDWLADQPGRTWQERWLASGADAAREG